MRFKLREVWEDHIRKEQAQPGKEGYNLTYRELARKAGVSLRLIQKVRKNENVTVETLEKIARVFGVKVADLMDEDED
jgi:transcriptional regulator with XRE-family HTH domain